MVAGWGAEAWGWYVLGAIRSSRSGISFFLKRRMGMLAAVTAKR